MQGQAFMESGWFIWFVLPMLVFLARILDVSLGTLRTIFIVKGFKYVVAVIGFIEILIWLLAIQQIMKNLDNPACYVAYAAGVSAGNFIGIWITEKLSLSLAQVKIVLRNDSPELIEALKTARYGLTCLDAQGAYGPVKLIFTVVARKSIEDVLKIVKTFDPLAFYTIEDVHRVAQNRISAAGKKRDAALATTWR